MSGRLILLTISFILTACQAVPIGADPSKTEKPRPVKPLPWVNQPTIQSDKTAAPKGFKLADPSDARKKATPKPGAKAASQIDNAAIAAKLAEAEDKAASALSMQQSAQTKDDWNLVFDRWKLAIQMLKTIPGKNQQVQQKVAEFQTGLEQATQAAKISLDPSLAPVDSFGANAKGVIGVPAAEAGKSAQPVPKASSADPQAAPSTQPNPSTKPAEPAAPKKP